jgi:hypothetical protein
MSSSETTAEELFHLDIHAWVDVQQTSHGVRHDDYAQYHGYCTRRLSRLSHKPDDVKSYLVHSSKYASSSLSSTTTTTTTTTATAKTKPTKSKTSRHAFCSRSHDTFALTQEVVVVVEEEEKDGEDSTASATTAIVSVPVPHENILWHLLVSAERSWAHANELSKFKTSNNKTIGRQPVLKKLKRANKWSKLLVEKAKTSADDETQRECEAYAAWMSANYALEKMDYQVCIVLYLFCLCF